jgi:pimeloyl-ACP methyl ester carboxylesterase
MMSAQIASCVYHVLTLAVVAAVTMTTASAQSSVSLPASDGGVVTADLYGSGPRAVILAHGGRFDRSSWAEQARILASAGWQVIAIDFRAAVAARAGRETDCLYDEACLAEDVLSAVRYLRARGATSVSVVGASLGGAGAARASIEVSEGEIDRIVLLAHMPIAEPERIKGRTLFIVGRNDMGSGETLRLPEIRDQYERAPQPKRLIILETSAHAQFIFATPLGPSLMQEILQFLEES